MPRVTICIAFISTKDTIILLGIIQRRKEENERLSSFSGVKFSNTKLAPFQGWKKFTSNNDVLIARVVVSI